MKNLSIAEREIVEQLLSPFKKASKITVKYIIPALIVAWAIYFKVSFLKAALIYVGVEIVAAFVFGTIIYNARKVFVKRIRTAEQV